MTPTQFAAALPAMRPGLVWYACKTRPCGRESGEDLVSDAVCHALPKLPLLDEATQPGALYSWLKQFLGFVILQDRRAASMEVQTVDIDGASSVQAPFRERSPAGRLEWEIRALPGEQQQVLRFWLDGYTQRWIADRLDCHPNTIANRLQLGFQGLRMAVPDDGAIVYHTGLHPCQGRGSIYRKQNSMARRWARHHPPEAPGRHWR